MPTADAYVAVLESWLAQGIHEDPPHSNRTPIGAEFGWNGVAWCCETQSVAQERVGLHCFHEAAVATAIAEAKQGLRGMVWLRADAVIAKADLPCFDFGPASGKKKGDPANFHISCVVDPGTQAKFQTIGGNENDAVTKQWRDRKYVQGFIRLPFDQPAPPPPTPATSDEEDEMYLVTYDNAENDPRRQGQYLIVGGTVFAVESAEDSERLPKQGAKEIRVHDKLYDRIAAVAK